LRRDFHTTFVFFVCVWYYLLAMEESFSTRPIAGRWIALDFRPTRPVTFLGPTVAALCGVIAAGGLTWHGQSLLIVILALLLCDPLLGAWRALWFGSELRAALDRASLRTSAWSDFDDYATSRLARLRSQIRRRIAFVRRVIWPLIDSEILGMFFAGILGLALAAVLGQIAVALTMLAMILALIEGRIGTVRGAGLRAIVEITIPWMIASSAFGYFTFWSFAFALVFTLIYRALLGIAQGQGQWLAWINLLDLLVIAMLIASNAIIGAAIVALGLIAHLLWQIHFRLDRNGRGYAQHVQSYILAAMLIAAFSLWF